MTYFIYKKKLFICGGANYYYRHFNIDLDELENEIILNEKLIGQLYLPMGNNYKRSYDSHPYIFEDGNKLYVVGHTYLTNLSYNENEPRISICDISNVNIFSNESSEYKDYVRDNSKNIINPELSLPQNKIKVYYDSPISIVKLNNKYFVYSRWNPTGGERHVQINIGKDIYNYDKAIKLNLDKNIDHVYCSYFVNINDKIYGLLWCYNDEHKKIPSAEKNKLYDNCFWVLVESTDGINFNILKNNVGVDEPDNNLFWPLRIKKIENNFEIIWIKYHKKITNFHTILKKYDKCIQIIKKIY